MHTRYELFQERPCSCRCVSEYAVLVCAHPSHPRLTGFNGSIPIVSPRPLQQNTMSDYQHLCWTRGGRWNGGTGHRVGEEEVAERQRGLWKREMGALSVERRSRKWWLEESFGREGQEERGNQEAERAWRGERLFRTRLKTLCRLSSPSPAPSGSIHGGADEGGEGGGGSCQQFI